MYLNTYKNQNLKIPDQWPSWYLMAAVRTCGQSHCQVQNMGGKSWLQSWPQSEYVAKARATVKTYGRSHGEFLGPAVACGILPVLQLKYFYNFSELIWDSLAM